MLVGFFALLYIEKRALDSYERGDEYVEISLGQWAVLGIILVFILLFEGCRLDIVASQFTISLDPGETMAFCFGGSTTSHFAKKD